MQMQFLVWNLQVKNLHSYFDCGHCVITLEKFGTDTPYKLNVSLCKQCKNEMNQRDQKDQKA